MQLLLQSDNNSWIFSVEMSVIGVSVHSGLIATKTELSDLAFGCTKGESIKGIIFFVFCMKHLCIVVVLLAVDSDQLTLCIVKQIIVLVKTVPTASHLKANNKTTHLKCICPFTCMLHIFYTIFSTLHCCQTVISFGTTLPQAQNVCITPHSQW